MSNRATQPVANNRLEWKRIVLGCVIALLIAVALDGAMVFSLGMQRIPFLTLGIGFVVAIIYTARTVSNRPFLHGLLIPVTYYLFSLGLALIGRTLFTLFGGQ